MRAKSLIRVFVFGLAGLTSVSTLANADSGSGSGKVIMLANAGPHTFGSTASPQFVRSPNYNSYLDFSQQVELAHAGPILLNTQMTRNARSVSLPAAAAAPRSFEDSLLLALLGLTLIAYQLFRKHRLLRPQPFTL
ncbi:MAG: hypothetical protein ACJ8OJ_12835 [Povalibacter sp.]